MTLKEAADLLDINLNEAVARFAGMETIYVKYLKKFADDDTMENLENAISQKDFSSIENNAHTLKGVCSNLGLNSLSKSAEKVVSLVRNGKGEMIFTDGEILSDLRKEYLRVCTTISQMD